MEVLAPLVVALPLLVAAVLIAAAHLWPSQWPDAIATLTAAAVAIMAVFLAGAAKVAPPVYWYGAWMPRHGVAIGIAFVVDPAGAGCVAFIAALFCASFVFAWGYFDEVHARYHALMLIFLAAMAGFALTGDLFNLFVFFELMSTVAFALTGYKPESSALEGTLNFTVTNGIGSFLMLAYGRTGALNFAQLSRALSGHPADALVILGFTLVMGALFIKGAIIPFHFWIADAYSVAPSPVCVIFSGIMVPIAIFGAARVYWIVFAEAGLPQAVLRPLLVWLGTATAVLGGLAALMQRDVKRLSAFPIVATVRSAAAAFTATGSLVPAVLDAAHWSAPSAPPAVTEFHPIGPVVGLSVALGIAALQLGRDHFPRSLVRLTHLAIGWIFAGLERLHDGVVGDYVLWLMVGLFVVGGVLAIG